MGLPVGGRDRFRRGELPFQVLADETVIVHPRTHAVHVLNETGSRLWELLAEERALDFLLATLCDEFEAPVEQIAGEVESFLDDLVQKRLVLVRPAAREDQGG